MLRIKIPSPAAFAVVVTLVFAAPVQAVGWDFAGLWPRLGAGWVGAFNWMLGSVPGTTKAGASTDPNGLGKHGASTDPDGLASSGTTTKAGAATDPNGLAGSSSMTEHGSSTDPNGGPQ